MKKIFLIFAVLCISLIAFSCNKNELKPLHSAFKKDFLVGAAVEPEQLLGAEGELLSRHFNSITAENVMKQLSLQPKEGKFNFNEADKLVAFAEKHKLKVRGHCLVWHHPSQMADWMFEDENGNPAGRELMLKRLRNHIKTVVERYKGKVYAWDVVNEAIDTSTADQLRHTEFYKLIGPDYIEKAFEYAHEADPDVKLFINEYDTFDPEKNKAYFKLIKSLIDKGIPISGIGLQMHVKMTNPSAAMIEQAINNLSVFGLDLHITELDMSFYDSEFGSFDQPSEQQLVYQAYRYKQIMDIFKKHNDSIKSVTFWGFHDGHTWLTSYPVIRNDWPLIFTADFKPKWVYYALTNPAKLPEYQDLPKKKAAEYEAHKGTPKIDGKIDKIWEKADSAETSIFITPYRGAMAVVRTLWDENRLYILAEVKDRLLSSKASEPYMQDSFEFFIDENNAKAGGYQSDDFQFRINYKNSVTAGGGNAQPEMIESRTVKTAGGYLIEAAFAFQSIKGAPGTEIGYELQINDDAEGDGIRKSVAKWNDQTNESYRNTEGWGILVMKE
ncbi:MAG: endo-1,4-beta-xylanase [Spirochaetes bacterium]|nr:endo-1,4-beta-xylanase [Spirochaetota bacterium]